MTQDGFAEALAVAILRRRLTLREVERLVAQRGVRVSQATLSYWQTGRSLPARQSSLEVVAALEVVLGLPVAYLTSRLPSDHVSRWDPVRAMELEGRPQALLRAMGIDPLHTLSHVYLQDSVRVSADGSEHHCLTHHLVRADVDGLDRMPIMMRQLFDDPVPLFEAGDGCRLGRVVDLDDVGLLAAELVLDRALSRGELYAFSYRMVERMPAGLPDNGISRVLLHQVAYLVMDVTFEGRVPVGMEYFTTPHEYVGDTNPANAQRQPLPLQSQVRVVVSDAAPGLHSIGWRNHTPPDADTAGVRAVGDGPDGMGGEHAA